MCNQVKGYLGWRCAVRWKRKTLAKQKVNKHRVCVVSAGSGQVYENTQNKSTYIGKENIGKIGSFKIEFSGGEVQSYFGQSSPAAACTRIKL